MCPPGCSVPHDDARNGRDRRARARSSWHTPLYDRAHDAGHLGTTNVWLHDRYRVSETSRRRALVRSALSSPHRNDGRPDYRGTAPCRSAASGHRRIEDVMARVRTLATACADAARVGDGSVGRRPSFAAGSGRCRIIEGSRRACDDRRTPAPPAATCNSPARPSQNFHSRQRRLGPRPNAVCYKEQSARVTAITGCALGAGCIMGCWRSGLAPAGLLLRKRIELRSQL